VSPLLKDWVLQSKVLHTDDQPRCISAMKHAASKPSLWSALALHRRQRPILALSSTHYPRMPATEPAAFPHELFVRGYLQAAAYGAYETAIYTGLRRRHQRVRLLAHARQQGRPMAETNLFPYVCWRFKAWVFASSLYDGGRVPAKMTAGPQRRPAASSGEVVCRC